MPSDDEDEDVDVLSVESPPLPPLRPPVGQPLPATAQSRQLLRVATSSPLPVLSRPTSPLSRPPVVAPGASSGTSSPATATAKKPASATAARKKVLVDTDLTPAQRLAAFLRQENVIVNEVPVPAPAAVRSVGMPWTHPDWATSAAEQQHRHYEHRSWKTSRPSSANDDNDDGQLDEVAEGEGVPIEMLDRSIVRWAESDAAAADVDPLALAGAWTEEEITLRRLQRQLQLRYLYEQELLDLQRRQREIFPELALPEATVLSQRLACFTTSSSPSVSAPNSSNGGGSHINGPTAYVKSRDSAVALTAPTSAATSAAASPAPPSPTTTMVASTLLLPAPVSASVDSGVDSGVGSTLVPLAVVGDTASMPRRASSPYYWNFAAKAMWGDAPFTLSSSSISSVASFPPSRSGTLESRRLAAIRKYGTLRRSAATPLRLSRNDRPLAPAKCQFATTDNPPAAAASSSSSSSSSATIPACSHAALPSSTFCLRHILNDPNQRLYRKCATDKCSVPILRFQHVQYCAQHIPT